MVKKLCCGSEKGKNEDVLELWFGQLHTSLMFASRQDILPSGAAMTCWVVTDGKPGMENQCIGLAERLGVNPVVKRIKLRSPWKQLSPFLRHGLDYAISPDGDGIAPPWPDVLIATGRASIPAALLVRRASRASGGPGTFCVQLQNPVIDPSRFDLVVVPRHDAMSGPNVMTTRGGLHRITPVFLKAEAEDLLPTLGNMPRPMVAVLLGGTNAVYQLTSQVMRAVAQQLAHLAKTSGGSLLITPSRRTGAENLAIVREATAGLPVYLWEGQGHNPYYGMLGLADYVVVTCDSVNMTTEACTTGKPVFVVDLPGGSDKFRRFHQSMRDEGLTRPFHGQLDTWSYHPVNDVGLVAARVKEMMQLRIVNQGAG